MPTTPKPIEPSSTLSSANVIGVQAEYIDEAWPHVQKWMSRVLNREGRWKESTIKEKIRNRDAQLWVAVDKEVIAIMVTQILIFDLKKVCLIWMISGTEMSRWVHLLDYVEAWAKENGCEELEVNGRPGWERVLRDFKRTNVVLRKKI